MGGGNKLADVPSEITDLLYFAGCAGNMTWPATGWSISRTVFRCCACSQSNASFTFLTGPQGIPCPLKSFHHSSEKFGQRWWLADERSLFFSMLGAFGCYTYTYLYFWLKRLHQEVQQAHLVPQPCKHLFENAHPQPVLVVPRCRTTLEIVHRYQFRWQSTKFYQSSIN